MMIAGLAGCGGDGGSGVALIQPDPPAVTEIPFASFAAIPPNVTVLMSGISQTASGDMTATEITSVAFGPVDTDNTSVKLVYDSDRQVSGASINTPQASLSFSKAAGDSVGCSSGICSFRNATAEADFIDATDPTYGWNYQTFGIWEKELSVTAYQLGVASVGYATPASAIPTTGQATFDGYATGFYVDPSGGAWITGACMKAVADFAARSIAFSTSSTQRTGVSQPRIFDTSLDLSGTFTYEAGKNLFSGSVSTVNSTLNGSATGRFYGPNAEEIGGVYSLRGTDARSSMLGAFGGKR